MLFARICFKIHIQLFFNLNLVEKYEFLVFFRQLAHKQLVEVFILSLNGINESEFLFFLKIKLHHTLSEPTLENNSAITGLKISYKFCVVLTEDKEYRNFYHLKECFLHRYMYFFNSV
jgi:hypothetical protein